MGDKITLKVDERTVHGKKVKQLRRDGIVPAVVYGPGMEPVAIQANQVELSKVYSLAGKHTPVHIVVGDKKRIAMIKDVEVDNVKRRINHVSFHAVRQDRPIQAEVPIRLVGEGESEAEKAGLIVLQTLDSVEVKALPLELPDSLELSIVGLKEAGERLLVSDIDIPENVEVVDNDDGRSEEDMSEEEIEASEANKIMNQVVVSVWEPSALQAANEASSGIEDESEVESEHGEEAPAEGEADETATEEDKQD